MRDSINLAIRRGVALISFTFSLQSQQAIGSSIVECGDAIKQLQASQSITEMIQELAALKISLDMAKLEGKSSAELKALNTDFENKEKILTDYLEELNAMTRAEFIELIRQEVSKLQEQDKIKVQQAQEKKQEEAREKKEQEKEIDGIIDGSRAISHRILPGTFKMGDIDKQGDTHRAVEVTLTKAFDMMATLTTQLFYREVVELADIRFPKKYELRPSPSKDKGDLSPVTHVSYGDVRDWISALNELSQAGAPELLGLIPGHKKGDVYRLPTEAEWEFVIRGRGAFNDAYHFGSTDADLGDYAWYSKNSGKTPHPVAQKKPLIVDGKKFYDMHGNVREWVQDWYDSNLVGGIDPQGPIKGKFRVLRGGSWFNNAHGMRSDTRVEGVMSDRWGSNGFRLVRVVN